MVVELELTKLFNHIPVKWKLLPSPNYKILKSQEISIIPTTVVKDKACYGLT